MLAIKGLPSEVEPSVGMLAQYLRVRHHSAVELINRAGQNGFVERERSANGRYVLVKLTEEGNRVLEQAVAERLKELQSAGPKLVDALRRLLRSNEKSKERRK
jgi:DNA-binding MarR family transcriptional regulator